MPREFPVPLPPVFPPPDFLLPPLVHWSSAPKSPAPGAGRPHASVATVPLLCTQATEDTANGGRAQERTTAAGWLHSVRPSQWPPRTPSAPRYSRASWAPDVPRSSKRSVECPPTLPPQSLPGRRADPPCGIPLPSLGWDALLPPTARTCLLEKSDSNSSRHRAHFQQPACIRREASSPTPDAPAPAPRGHATIVLRSTSVRCSRS